MINGSYSEATDLHEAIPKGNAFRLAGVPCWPKTQGSRSCETFRIDYLIRGPKVEKLGFEPVRYLRDQRL